MKILGYEAEITESEEGFTMYCKNITGGAIIFNKNKDECIKEFTEAMELAIVLKRVMEFKMSKMN